MYNIVEYDAGNGNNTTDEDMSAEELADDVSDQESYDNENYDSPY